MDNSIGLSPASAKEGHSANDVEARIVNSADDVEALQKPITNSAVGNEALIVNSADEVDALREISQLREEELQHEVDQLLLALYRPRLQKPFDEPTTDELCQVFAEVHAKLRVEMQQGMETNVQGGNQFCVWTPAVFKAGRSGQIAKQQVGMYRTRR